MRTNRTIYTMSELNLAFMSMYNKLNDYLFEGKLEKVIITFEPGYKKGAYGWFNPRKDWTQGKEERYVINISSDFLNRDTTAIIGTLLHEMCHLYAEMNGIKDTSRSGIYHNKKFKEIAESHGLSVTEYDKIGFGVTCLNDNIKDWLKSNLCFSKISLHHKIFDKKETEKKPSSTRKYICPCCDLIVRATKDCKLICAECEEEMILKQ